ncbi:MAG: hypothetical protein CTY20_11575 [Hyphomicrobium sp.]|nr:MAG: hypothetical protein CTY20_11575 [Hyphomicrobium sp.]
MRSFETIAKRFLHEADGAIAIIFGLSALTLMTIVGITMDASRAYNISNRVQNALDSASLAAARRMSLDEASDDEVREAALGHFNSQKEQFKVWGAVASNPQVSIDRGNASVTMTADVNVSSIAGSLSTLLPNLAFSPSSTSTFDVKRIELALVLDVTGSMCAPNPSPCTGGPKFEGLKKAVEDFVNIFANTTTSRGLVRVALVPYSGAVNVGGYKNVVAHSPNPGDDCVVERDGSEAYTDAAASGNAQVDTSSTSDRAYYGCLTSQIVPLSDVADAGERTNLINHAKAMVAEGWTAGHIGAAWGWYMVSPSWTSIWPATSDPKPYGKDVIKAVVLMTDGEFNTAYRNGGTGYPDSSSTDVNFVGSSPYQAIQLCNNMKAAKVQVFSIAYMAPLNAEALLKSCSGDANYYDAANAGQLQDSFRAIAEKLTSLKIAK